MSHTTLAWEQYEAGKACKRQAGLYATVRQNERFYRGDQWSGSHADLPHPVFNIVRRVADFMIASVLPEDVTVRYADSSLPFCENSAVRAAIEHGLSVLERNAAWRWKREGMLSLLYRALLDGAISGDGIFYCWWDAGERDGQLVRGDIRTDLVNNTDLFVPDVNSSDLQSQRYVMLSGRESVAALREEARAAGRSAEEILRIVPDSGQGSVAGDYGTMTLRGEEKTTVLLKFYRDEDGKIVFEKSTKECVIKTVTTDMTRYPVAGFHWNDIKNCYFGSAPVSDLIANQKYINTAYAMAMKHMSDTAFSKVVYDKSRIPEWSNEVGEAIAAVGGGNVSDAVSVVGVGRMQEGYLDLIASVIEQTKRMIGASDSALGDERANNTSAILALQQASRMGLAHVRANFRKCLGELALIWADMLCAYSTEDRKLMTLEPDGSTGVGSVPFPVIRRGILTSAVDTVGTGELTPSATVTVLDKLLSHGAIDATQYLEMLPEGVIADRRALLQKLSRKGEHRNE